MIFSCKDLLVMALLQTLAYMLPVLSLAIQRAEAEFAELSRAGRPGEAGAVQALVIAPSRELAMQIVRVGQSLLPAEARGCVQQAIGGANPVRQVGSQLELCKIAAFCTK